MEKFLKAFLLSRDWHLKRLHNLDALLDDAVVYDTSRLVWPYIAPAKSTVAHSATTVQGKFEGLVRGPFGIAWDPDAPLYRSYAADSSWNAGHLYDHTITAMLKAQRRTQDLETRRKIIFDIQRYAAQQQYYVYTNVMMVTASWAPYVKNYGPTVTFDYGSRAAALWLDR